MPYNNTVSTERCSNNSVDRAACLTKHSQEMKHKKVIEFSEVQEKVQEDSFKTIYSVKYQVGIPVLYVK